MSNNRPLCNNSKQQYLNNNLYQDRRIFLRTVGGWGVGWGGGAERVKEAI